MSSISRKLVHLQAAWPAFSQGDQENRRPSVTIAGWAENDRIPDCPSSQAQTGTRKRGPGGGLCHPMPLFVGEDRGGGSSRWQDVLEGYDVLYGSDRRFQVVRYGPHKSAASLTCGT